MKLHDRVSIGLMDADSLNFKDNTFDRVVSSVTLHHLKDKLPVLKTVFRILKPGFGSITVKRVPRYKAFGIGVAKKP